MSYHTSGSMGRMNGYGTIKIFLQNTSGLTQGQEYPYTIQGQPQEHTATADRVEGQTVLVDSNYTIGENPPPFSAGMSLTVFIPQVDDNFPNVPLLTTIINDIKPLEQELVETQITTTLYDGANLRTFHLQEEMPIQEFLSTILKDVPVEGIEELDSNNEVVNTYDPTQPETQATTVVPKSSNRKKKKKNKFKLKKEKGKRVVPKNTRSITDGNAGRSIQPPGNGQSNNAGRSATTTPPGDISGNY